MLSWIPNFVGKLGGVDDHPDDLRSNFTWIMSRSRFGLGEIHQFPYGYSTVLPACYEPPFPSFDLRVAKLLILVVIIHVTTFPYRSRGSARARSDSAFSTLGSKRARRWWSISREGQSLISVFMIVEGSERFECLDRIESYPVREAHKEIGMSVP